jgi:lipoyl-dependent peroxiredoxin
LIRKAKAVWRGTGRDGCGKVSIDSGALAETPYSFRIRFENENGTNPEEPRSPLSQRARDSALVGRL